MVSKEILLFPVLQNWKSRQFYFRFFFIVLSSFLVLMALFSCNHIQNSADESIAKNQYIFSIQNGKVILLYKLQKQIASATNDTLLLRRMMVDRIYLPNERLFNYCLGYEKESFADRYTSAMLSKADSLIKLVRNYEAANLDEIIIKTMNEIANKSIIPFEGQYTIGFFEDAGCIMCGCDNTTMLGNTYNPTYKNPEALKVVIAHEVNHNFFETAKKEDPDKNTVLYNAIDEGFANLFSMKAMNVDKLQAFNMSGEEYEWLEENESELKAAFKKVLFSDKEEDWDPYSEKVPDRIIEGSPGDIGYFIGFRIIEQWLANDQRRKWQDVYTTPVRSILLESSYFE